MNNSFKWLKCKKEDIAEVEKLLRENEENCVSACGRFLSRDEKKDPVWILKHKTSGIKALLINSRSALMPVFAGFGEIPSLDFLGGFLRKKNISSVQGLTSELILLEEVLRKKGMKARDVIDYNLMSLDEPSKINTLLKYPDKLELCVPQFNDAEDLAPLQEGYEKEEVMPKGSVYNPLTARLNIAKIIKNGKILAAKLDGRFVGKININAVSFSRYQIGGVYVCPEFRGQGIAGIMTQEFIKSLLTQDKTRGLTLFVKKNNIPALKLYKSLGFVTCNDYRIIYY